MKNPWVIRGLTVLTAVAAFLASGAPVTVESVLLVVSGAITGALTPQLGKKAGA